MAIRVVRKGTHQPEVWEGACPACGCSIECARDDGRFSPAQRAAFVGTDVLYVACPTADCDAIIACTRRLRVSISRPDSSYRD